MYTVITSDLHPLPLVIIEARNFDELIEQLAMWDFEGKLDDEDVAVIEEALREAKAPNDGLLGMVVTRELTGVAGMKMHICAPADHELSKPTPLYEAKLNVQPELQRCVDTRCDGMWLGDGHMACPKCGAERDDFTLMAEAAKQRSEEHYNSDIDHHGEEN